MIYDSIIYVYSYGKYDIRCVLVKTQKQLEKLIDYSEERS